MKLSHKATLVAMMIAGLLASSARADDPKETAEWDQLLIKAQKICPVMGTKLGDHGEPRKAKVGEMNLFLCCKGCFGRKISRENWTKVLGHLAKAQRICPVMKKPLPKNPKSVVVNNRIVFVCCPPCIKKVQADPDKYLAIVNEQLKKNVGSKE